jgi:multisubunit Na+/H+ antiporter MnhB subunit
LNKISALIVCVITALLLLYSAEEFPYWSDPRQPASLHVSPRYIEKTVAETKVPNAVTSVLADYRGYDTMFETSVIFTAGIAVMMLLRRSRDGD